MQNAFSVVNIENIYTHSLRTEHFTFLAQHSPEVSDLGVWLRPDEFNLDVFHHGIISSNVVLTKVLVAVLTAYPCIAETKLSYLHLAAILGHKALEDDVKKLCEIMKPDKQFQGHWWSVIHDLKENQDFKKMLQRFLDDEQFDLVFQKCQCLLMTTLEQREEMLSAVDVAAICKNSNYVDLFLQKLALGRKSHRLSVALGIHSSWAVRFVADAVEEKDLYELLSTRVKDLRVEEARLILKTKKIDPMKPRNEPNLFHLACSTKIQREGLDEMVSLLIDYGFDINDNSHPCTYPLHSMIYSFVCERDINPKKVPVYHINSLHLMLRRGANPNFDENKNPAVRNRRESLGTTTNFVTLRDPNSSALDCYFHCLQFHEKWDVNIMEQLDQICLLLLENGADPTYLDVNCGSPLHSLMQLSACHHAQGHLSADFFSMSRMLLYFGADPDHRPEGNPHYPVEFYFFRVFDLMGGRIAFDRWTKHEAMKQILGLVTYMNRDDALQAYQSVCTKVNEMVAEGEVGFEEVAGYVKSTIKEYLTHIRSLQDFCRLAQWRGHGRKVNNLKRVHMPKKMLDGICSFFSLEI